jgi:hypothetical protein
MVRGRPPLPCAGAGDRQHARHVLFWCLLYADDTDFPATIELGVLRPDGLQVERFRNRFDL